MLVDENGRNAVALQERITPEDLADPEMLAALAAAANLSPKETAEYFAPR